MPTRKSVKNMYLASFKNSLTNPALKLIVLTIFTMGLLEHANNVEAGGACNLDVSNSYLEQEFLGKSQADIKKNYPTKLFEVYEFGDKRSELRLDVCGNYEMALQFNDGLVSSIKSGANIFQYDNISLFDVSLNEIETLFPDGKSFWAWNEGQRLFFRFEPSKMTLDFGYVKDAESCVSNVQSCMNASEIKPKYIFTYELLAEDTK